MTMPALFIGHGSPMNALADNAYSRALSSLAQELPRPEALLVVSAHWETSGTKVLSTAHPKTIHDFYGFPPALFAVQYPAPGAPAAAAQANALLSPASALDSSWGLDHGAWSVLRHMYPAADVPVFQLSLDQNLSAQEHFELAQKLRPLRKEGILILGSGNITHNLRRVDFAPDAKPMGWAVEFDEMIREALEQKNLPRLLLQEPELQSLWAAAHPTLEHYFPLLYALGASFDDEKPVFPYTQIQNGSLSMRSVRYG